MNPYLRNVRLVYALHASNALVGAFAVVFTLFLLANGLSFTQIGILSAVFLAVLVVAESPTGAFTDKYGRKCSLQLSSFLFLLGSALYAVSDTFSWFLIADSLFALGTAFWSGTTDSLLYESLRKIKRTKEYERILAQNHSLFVVVGVGTSFLIPLLFAVDINFPFIIGVFFALLSLVICFFLTDTGIRSKESHTLQLISGMKRIKRSKALVWLLFFGTLFAIPIGLFGDILNQPLVADRYDLFMYGVIFAVASALQALFVWKIDVIKKHMKSKYLVLTLLWPVLLLGLLIDNIVLLILLLSIIWWVGSARYIFISNDINKRVRKDSERATVHSLNSQAISIAGLIVAPLFGLFLDMTSLVAGVYVLAVLGLASGIVVWFFKPKNV